VHRTNAAAEFEFGSTAGRGRFEKNGTIEEEFRGLGMRLNNLLRNDPAQPAKAADLANTATEISRQSEAVLQSYDPPNDTSLSGAPKQAEDVKPREPVSQANEGAQLEIERIASAVDLAISLEDN
jgi:hypothetical protein